MDYSYSYSSSFDFCICILPSTGHGLLPSSMVCLPTSHHIPPIFCRHQLLFAPITRTNLHSLKSFFQASLVSSLSLSVWHVIFLDA